MAIAEKRTEGQVIKGVYVPPNACPACGKWYPPWKAGVSVDVQHLYCWGCGEADDEK